MKRFIPKEKLSKKAKRLLDAQRRQTWVISPVSRKSTNKKAYDRKTLRRDENGYPTGGAFAYQHTVQFFYRMVCWLLILPQRTQMLVAFAAVTPRSVSISAATLAYLLRLKWVRI